MRDPIDFVKELADLARREVRPQGHVAHEVIRRLPEKKPLLMGPLTVFALASAVLAIGALGIAVVSVRSAGTANTASGNMLSAFFQLASDTQFERIETP